MGAHDAVLALLDWLPEDVAPDAELVAALLNGNVPEPEAARFLDELEAAGCVASAAVSSASSV